MGNLPQALFGFVALRVWFDFEYLLKSFHMLLVLGAVLPYLQAQLD